MFIGNPTIFVVIGAVLGSVSIGFWFAFRHWLPLLVGLSAWFIAIVVVVASLLIDSPREQVERTLHRLAQAVQSNDANRVLEYISDSAPAARVAARQEMQQTQFNICWITQIHEIQFDEPKLPHKAHVVMTVVVDVEKSRYDPGRGRVQIWLDLVKESDNRWRVISYRYDVE